MRTPDLPLTNVPFHLVSSVSAPSQVLLSVVGKLNRTSKRTRTLDLYERIIAHLPEGSCKRELRGGGGPPQSISASIRADVSYGGQPTRINRRGGFGVDSPAWVSTSKFSRKERTNRNMIPTSLPPRGENTCRTQADAFDPSILGFS